MKKEVSGTVSNDLGNAFIWSGFKYYLRQPTDSYIVYSPVKYWKAQHLVNKKFVKGFAFNRRHFHTNIDACIMVALWENTNCNIDRITLEGYDIIDNEIKKEPSLLDVSKINTSLADAYYDRKSIVGDTLDGICTGLDGKESFKTRTRVKKMYNDNLMCFLVANSTGFDNPDLNFGLTIAGRYDGNGFFVRKDNYLEKLPLFAASRYITYNRKWTERARIMKSGDGKEKFLNDIKNGKLTQFLLKVLLFTIFEMHNHVRTFWGSDGRFYRNELCLDTTNGETIASQSLKELKANEKEKAILKQWDMILENAKKTKNYNASLTYGIYQIFDELDTSHNDVETDSIIYDYPELHGNLQTLKKLVKEYYNEEIVPVLFKYEFLK